MEGIYSVMKTILPLEAYQYNFMIRALLAVILLTPALGLLGTMAVNHQMAFFSDGLGHSAMLGIGLGIVLGLKSDLVAMLIFGVIWAVLICVIKQSGAATTDTIISVFTSTSIAGGLLLLSRSDKLSKSLLIGDILAVMPQDLLYLLLLLAGVIVLWIVLYNPLLMTSVDPFLARSRGIRTRVIECAFVVMVAVAVMISIHWAAACGIYGADRAVQRDCRADGDVLPGRQRRRVDRAGGGGYLCAESAGEDSEEVMAVWTKGRFLCPRSA